MLNDEVLIQKAKRLIEERIKWGDSNDWTNQDFVALSEKIQKETRAPLSHVTLKRIWGKVKYESLPNTHTLNTLVQFVGYESWRDFKLKNGNGSPLNGNQSNGIAEDFADLKPEHLQPIIPSPEARKKHNLFFKLSIVTVAIAVLAAFIFLGVSEKESPIDPDDFSFSSKKVISRGVPNSVVFEYDASRAPEDSVIIQQSWDTRRRTKVSKNNHQHTSIYYLPDFYFAKLIVGNKIVKEHKLFIQSDGWLTAVNVQPVPVYFKKEDVFHDGKMSLSKDKIEANNIRLQPEAPSVVYANVKDFGEIFTDNFIFETSLKNDYNEGSSVCQKTNIYLLCEGAAVGVPLCAKGCVSDMDVYFSGFYASGKQNDLSAFGVDFNDFVKVRIESSKGKAKIFLNDKLSYEIDKNIIPAKIIGIDFVFQGTGTVDYVRLTNGKVVFEDTF